MPHLLTVLSLVFVFIVAPAAAHGTDAGTPPHKAVLVTGASSGIGKIIATTLAENGFYVYAGARKAQDIKALSALSNIQGIRLDVTIQSDIDAAVETIRSEGRGLFGLVNNAGVFLYGPLIEISERDMQFVMDVNVFGPYRVAKAFAPLIIDRKGRIMTTGSLAGIFSGSLFGPYGMSKHAMESFTEALSQEMIKFEVEVGIVEPGNFRSDIMKNMNRRTLRSVSSDRTSQYETEIANFSGFVQQDRSHHIPATSVANAVLEFMTVKDPKLRYMVTPNQAEADYAIRRSLQKVVELNHGQLFANDREQLVKVLDELLAEYDQ